MSDVVGAQPAVGTKGEERVSTVVGDRMCIRCGFNLTGQMVIREPHYQMLIVRCPECSTAAALQEYPALGRWANRWAALLAGLWLLVVIALLFASAGSIFGFTMLAADNFGDRYATHIAQRHREWIDSLTAEEQATVGGGNYQWISTQEVGPDSWVDAKWWDGQDGAALLSEVGGPIGGLDFRGLWNWPWLGVMACVVGAVWSVVMLAQRQWRVIVAMPIPLAIAGAFAYFALASNSYSYWGGGARPVSQIANDRLWPIVVPGLLISALPMMWLGAWTGRPLVRGLVRAFLPPRMMGSLAFLWMLEGKPPPRPGPRAT